MKLNQNTASYLESVSHKPAILNDAHKQKVKAATKSAMLYGAASLSMLSALVLGTVVGVYKVQDYFASNRVEFHLPLSIATQKVVEITPVKTGQVLAAVVEPVKVKTDMEIIEGYKLAPFIKGIYFLESTSGKNDWCKSSGQFNGFGYRQNSHEKKCYKDFESVTDEVNEWLEDRLSTNGNDIVEAVCYYNTGYSGKAWCEYSQNFLSFVTKTIVDAK